MSLFPVPIKAHPVTTVTHHLPADPVLWEAGKETGRSRSAAAPSGRRRLSERPISAEKCVMVPELTTAAKKVPAEKKGDTSPIASKA